MASYKVVMTKDAETDLEDIYNYIAIADHDSIDNAITTNALIYKSLFILFSLLSLFEVLRRRFGAGNETRTRDPNLGKVVLYQLSYSRIW